MFSVSCLYHLAPRQLRKTGSFRPQGSTGAALHADNLRRTGENSDRHTVMRVPGEARHGRPRRPSPRTVVELIAVLKVCRGLKHRCRPPAKRKRLDFPSGSPRGRRGIEFSLARLRSRKDGLVVGAADEVGGHMLSSARRRAQGSARA